MANWWEAAPLASEASPAAKTVEAKPDRGVMDATARGVAQGATGNFYDELRGLVEAGGAKEKDPASLYSVISGLYRRATGAEGAEEAYTTARDRERAIDKTANEQHPIASTVGNIGGSIAATAVPVGMMGQAATMGGRMVQGAKVGSALGAVSGAGEGEGAMDTAARTTMGLGVGGVLGAAATPIVEGVVRGASALARPVVNGIRGALSPDDEAARRVASAVTKDIQTDRLANTRLTPREFGENVQAGGPATIMDMGGETTRALARSAANTSTEGRFLLNQTIDERFEAQGPRVVNWLRSTFHYPNAHAQQEALTTAARAANRPAYLKAYQEGSGGIWDDGLEQISQAPIVQDAIRKATVTGGNDAARAGFTPVRNPFTFNRETGRMELSADAQGNRAIPNLQFWDSVKQNLDRVGTRDAQDFARVLREHLDTFVPSYRTARQGAMHFFNAENALEAGENFVSSKLGNDQARAALARMTPNERQLFQDGFVSRYIDTLSEVGDRRTILNQIGQSPAARERLNMVLGPQRARELEATLRVEGIMDLARGSVQGNSTTARQLAELGFAGGAGSVGAYGAYNMDPAQMTYAAMAGALLGGKKAIDGRVAGRVAQMLVSNDPQTMLRGIRLLTNNNRMMDALRSTDRRIAAFGGLQAPTGGAVQSVGVSRAEGDQPGVERPLN